MAFDNARSSEADRFLRAHVQVSSEVIAVLSTCHMPVPDWLSTLAAEEEDSLLSCGQLLALAALVAHAHWECEQASGETTADTGAAVCGNLLRVLERALDNLLVGREVVVHDSWMMKDPDDDLQRPTVHRGKITAWKTTPALTATLTRDSGSPMTAPAHLWTVTDRTTGKVLFGPLP
ncbi:hypothetical protein ACH47C_24120 [Streptomyces rishiriensis]|uniref:hypothetical protein n=1 Tax=Streptomyces rishiriensis TaxID=68264 RepID=UPI0033F4BD11